MLRDVGRKQNQVSPCDVHAVEMYVLNLRLDQERDLMARELISPLGHDIEGVQAPMVYIREDLTWEYKRISCDLEKEEILDVEELNELGSEGWELATNVTVGSVVNFYFCRPKK